MLHDITVLRSQELPNSEMINLEVPFFASRDHANQLGAQHLVNQSKQPEIHGLNGMVCFGSQPKNALLQDVPVILSGKDGQQTEVLTVLDLEVVTTA